MKRPPRYLLMDYRYVTQPDDAVCLDTADSLDEARKAARLQGGGCIVDAQTDALVEVVE